MIALVPDRLQQELIDTLTHGLVARARSSKPPSRELVEIVRLLSSSSVVTTGQPPPAPLEMRHDGAMNRTEAAAHLGISVSTLDRRARDGDLEPKRIGRRVVFPRTVLDEYLGEGASKL